MSVPTRTAAAGRFQAKGGEDAVQYLDETGKIVAWSTSDGTYFCTDCVVNGTSVSDIIMSGLPSDIDAGTF